MWWFRKKQNLALALGFADLFVMAAIRSMDIGRDNGSYEKIFQKVSRGDITLSNTNGYEWGYIFLNQLVGRMHGEIRTLLVVVSFLFLFGVFYYVKKNAIYPWISIYFYICMYYYQQSFTIWRQALAISIVLFAYIQLEERKYIRYFLLVLLAALFHRSALLALAPFLVQYIKITKKWMLFLIGMFAVVYGFRNQIVQLAFTLQIQRLSMYMDSVVSEEGYEQLIMYSAMLLFVIYSALSYYSNVKHQRMKKDGALELRLHQSVTLGILMVGTQLLATYFSLLTRAGLFFSVPFVLLLPNTFNCYSDKWNRKFFRYVLYVVFLLFYLYMMISGDDVYYTMWHV
jgi:hypothetical protein